MGHVLFTMEPFVVFFLRKSVVFSFLWENSQHLGSCLFGSIVAAGFLVAPLRAKKKPMISFTSASDPPRSKSSPLVLVEEDIGRSMP